MTQYRPGQGSVLDRIQEKSAGGRWSTAQPAMSIRWWLSRPYFARLQIPIGHVCTVSAGLQGGGQPRAPHRSAISPLELSSCHSTAQNTGKWLFGRGRYRVQASFIVDQDTNLRAGSMKGIKILSSQKGQERSFSRPAPLHT